jgi:carnitine-CoA ligase
VALLKGENFGLCRIKLTDDRATGTNKHFRQGNNMGFIKDRSRVVIRYVVERHAIEQPHKKCMIFEDDEEWTYQEALLQGYKAANMLSEFGIKRGDRIMILLPNYQGWIRSWWGITFLGAVMVPVNTAYKGDMLKHIIRDSQAGHIITSPEMTGLVKELDPNIHIIDPAILSAGPAGEPKLDRPLEPWDTAALIYTSGTTGASKGVITSYNLMYFCALSCQGRASKEDTLLVDAPLFHIMGLNHANVMLALGGRLVVRAIFSRNQYWEIIRKNGVTISQLLGTMVTFLISAPTRPNDADNPLRGVVIAPMIDDPAGFMERFGIKELYTSYGMTETNLVFTLTVTPDFLKTRTCGRVVDGVQVQLVDDNDIPVPTGKVGELVFRNEYPWRVMGGYWGRPGATAQAWRNGWYHTGDYLFCDEEGYYYFADRKKDAIRRRGENISSFEVEREVLSYPDIQEVACVAVPSEFGEDEVKVFVKIREDVRFDPAELVHYLIPRMPYFMVPRYIERLDGFPKTPTDRIKKFELRARGNSSATWDREASGIVVKRN